MKRFPIYLLITVFSFAATYTIQQKIASLQSPPFKLLSNDTEIANSISSIETPSSAIQLSEHPKITSEEFTRLLNHSRRTQNSSQLIEIFDEWTQTNFYDAINWLESNQILITQHPEILDSIVNQTNNLNDLIATSELFLFRYQPLFLSSFISNVEQEERLSTFHTIIPFLNKRYKSDSLAEIGKHLLPADLDKLHKEQSLSTTDLSYLATGISMKMPTNGPKNRFDWLLSLEEHGYNLPICLNLALQSTINESDGESSIDFIESLLPSKPELANSLIRQTERKLRKLEPIDALSFLSQHGSVKQFGFALQEAYSLNPQATKNWLNEPENREISQVVIKNVANSEAKSRGTMAFELLNYTPKEEMDSVVRQIIYSIDKSIFSEKEIQDHIVNSPSLSDLSKQKAQQYLSKLTIPNKS